MLIFLDLESADIEQFFRKVLENIMELWNFVYQLAKYYPCSEYISVSKH